MACRTLANLSFSDLLVFSITGSGEDDSYLLSIYYAYITHSEKDFKLMHEVDLHRERARVEVVH